jgi:hypothetical protein
VREIRTLRATGRGLETEPWRGLRHRQKCAVETTLLYHADILGRLGDETPDWQVARRQQVTRHVLGRIFESKQHGSP